MIWRNGNAMVQAAKQDIVTPNMGIQQPAKKYR